jgi:hypothetical protein
MKYQLTQLGHYILGIFFSCVYLLTADHYLHYEVEKCFVYGLFFIIIGIWGNKAKLVFFRVPWGEKSYKYINYVSMIIGTLAILYSGYLFIRCNFSFAC